MTGSVTELRVFSFEPTAQDLAGLLSQALRRHGRPRPFVSGQGSQFTVGHSEGTLDSILRAVQSERPCGRVSAAVRRCRSPPDEPSLRPGRTDTRTAGGVKLPTDAGRSSDCRARNYVQRLGAHGRRSPWVPMRNMRPRGLTGIHSWVKERLTARSPYPKLQPSVIQPSRWSPPKCGEGKQDKVTLWWGEDDDRCKPWQRVHE